MALTKNPLDVELLQVSRDLRQSARDDAKRYGPRQQPIASFREVLTEALRDEWTDLMTGNTGVPGL